MPKQTPETLERKTCKPCSGDTPALKQERINELLGQIQGWEQKDSTIEKEFKFEDFYDTIEFVNAIAWVANRENHHPDLEVGYNRCRVQFSTHAIKGLSENDFICEAKVNALVAPQAAE